MDVANSEGGKQQGVNTAGDVLYRPLILAYSRIECKGVETRTNMHSRHGRDIGEL
jgi:hypothetical protein